MSSLHATGDHSYILSTKALDSSLNLPLTKGQKKKKKKILIFLFGLLNKTVCCCCWLTIPTLSLLDQLNSYYALWIGSGALTRPNRKPPAKWKSYNSCADLQRGRCGQESVECLLRVKVTALTGCNMRLFRCSTGLHIQLSQTTS